MAVSDAVRALDQDLREIFGDRLQSVVVYATVDHSPGPTAATLAVVESLTPADLRACAGRVEAWQDSGLATPLILESPEFARSLDAFPFEFGAILADYEVVSGGDPFTELRVDSADVRRACEVQARSHLLHLREGYMETRGRSDALAELIARSAAPLAALLRNVRRLDSGRPIDPILTEVASLDAVPSSDAARRIFPQYLSAIGQLTNAIDRWGHT
jgi:hypothetical protein